MRDFLKRGPRWLHAGWLLPMVLLALPNCSLDVHGLGDPNAPATVFEPGEDPTSAVMCDIPKVPDPATECATPADEASLKSTAWAAIGLAEGQQASLVLDYTPNSTCSGPRKVNFFGKYPDGSHVCLNCSTQIGPMSKYADPKAVCVAKCIDLVNKDGVIPEGGAQTYCEANARVSTNVNETCYGDACTNGGNPIDPFKDPRRKQEPVKWTDFEGAIALGSATGGLDNTLTGMGNTGDFDASAQSEHLITKGDAWIEFEAKETGVSHVVGISTDTGIASDLAIGDLTFALSLNYDDSNAYVLENGASVAIPVGKYQPAQRFRIEIKDNHNQTATISYSRIDVPCTEGTPCMTKTPLGVGQVSQMTIAYPLRVSALFREPGATLENVTMVRIQEQP